VTNSLQISTPPAASKGSHAAASTVGEKTAIRVALLTGGGDKPYALGLASALLAQGITFDFIGSDEVDSPELHDNPRVKFLNLRGEQSREAGALRKLQRVLLYYARLIRYAATARPRIFHLLWNNKFEAFDRTLLTLYYRALGKRLVFTAHNVNARKRDGNDTFFNRFTLKIQYSLVDHIFVHTEKMRAELLADFGVPEGKATVIPFGINNTLPNTSLSREEARQAFRLEPRHKTLLFFGNIAPYKGLEHLLVALAAVAKTDRNYRLIVAGAVKNCGEYWEAVQKQIDALGIRELLIEKIGYIPDEEGEKYFKAADVLLLPYNHIFQSGVLFLGYSFGLPVIVTDVGSLRDDVIEGKTGFICRPQDPVDLARSIETYFASELFQHLETRRLEIQRFANERYSWRKVAGSTEKIYSRLLS
jgi:glycosyltransferase involved in cell wall biosynthesis